MTRRPTHTLGSRWRGSMRCRKRWAAGSRLRPSAAVLYALARGSWCRSLLAGLRMPSGSFCSSWGAQACQPVRHRPGGWASTAVAPCGCQSMSAPAGGPQLCPDTTSLAGATSAGAPRAQPMLVGMAQLAPAGSASRQAGRDEP